MSGFNSHPDNYSVLCGNPVFGHLFTRLQWCSSLFLCAGLNGTQVSVVQYGDTNTAEITWKDEQSKSHLLNLVESIPSRTTAAPALGSGYINYYYTTVCIQLHTHAHIKVDTNTLSHYSVCLQALPCDSLCRRPSRQSVAEELVWQRLWWCWWLRNQLMMSNQQLTRR